MIIAPLAVLVPGVATGAIELPYTFKAGTPISSAAVNETLTVLADAINGVELSVKAVDERVDVLAGAEAQPQVAYVTHNKLDGSTWNVNCETDAEGRTVRNPLGAQYASTSYTDGAYHITLPGWGYPDHIQVTPGAGFTMECKASAINGGAAIKCYVRDAENESVSNGPCFHLMLVNFPD